MKKLVLLLMFVVLVASVAFAQPARGGLGRGNRIGRVPPRGRAPARRSGTWIGTQITPAPQPTPTQRSDCSTQTDSTFKGNVFTSSTEETKTVYTTRISLYRKDRSTQEDLPQAGYEYRVAFLRWLNPDITREEIYDNLTMTIIILRNRLERESLHFTRVQILERVNAIDRMRIFRDKNFR